MQENQSSPYIHEAGADNFTAMVLENSRKGPVLVNFWSKSAESCLQQYPLLDRIIQHYDGRVLLINIDVDREAALASQYGIASVPGLKLFRNENVVETRHGYQSEEELVKLLEPHVARESDQVLADAVQMYVDGKTVEAYEKIANAIAEDPINHRLPLTMCKLLKHEGRFDEAIRLLDSMSENIRKNIELEQFYSQLSLLRELELNTSIESLKQELEARPDDLNVRRQLFLQYVLQSDYEPALQQLVQMIELDASFDDNYPQQAMLKLFNVLGPEHPLVGQYRPNLKRYIH